MRKWLIVSVLAVAGVLASTERASADHPFCHPYTSPAVFPGLNPPGYYTATYYNLWYFPWYANYNYSSSPYANWGGRATYGGDAAPHPYGVGIPNFANQQSAAPVGEAPVGDAPKGETPKRDTTNEDAPIEGTVSITLPADAKLLFNGTAANGIGQVRTFRTPPLTRGQEYAYDLTAEVVRDGQVVRATERVIVRAGAKSTVTLTPAVTQTAAK